MTVYWLANTPSFKYVLPGKHKLNYTLLINIKISIYTELCSVNTFKTLSFLYFKMLQILHDKEIRLSQTFP